MRTAYEIISAIIFVLINAALVSVVFYFNQHPSKKYGNKKLSPEQLAEAIARDIKEQPEYYTYEKKANGKYSVFKINRYVRSEKSKNNPKATFTYKEEPEYDYPVDFDGNTSTPMIKENFAITHESDGFKIPGVKQPFKCPNNYNWDEEKSTCIEKPLCDKYDDSLLEILDRYYTEIDNPSITPVTELTGVNRHPRLYIKCSSKDKKPIIQSCTEENEKIDFSVLNSNSKENPCKVYDVCRYLPDETRHHYTINYNYDDALKMNHYYQCYKKVSVKHKCPDNYEFNEKYFDNNNVCIPKNHCRSDTDYYFTTTPNSYSICLSNKKIDKSCAGVGIIKLTNNTYQCKSIDYNNHTEYSPNIYNGFKYNSKSNIGYKKFKLRETVFDNWFHDKFPKIWDNIKDKNLYLPSTPIENDIVFQYRNEKRMNYENSNDMLIPTKFYFSTEIDKWTLFDESKLNFIIETYHMLDTFKPVRISVSNLFNEVNCKINSKKYLYNKKYNPTSIDHFQVEIDPSRYHFDDTIKEFWIIINAQIYHYIFNKTQDNSKNTTVLGSSKNYYSFIEISLLQPTKIMPNTIIASALKKVEGIHYAYCIKYDNYFTVNKSPEINNKIICHKDLKNLIDKEQQPVTISQLELDLNKLKLTDKILPIDFPDKEFIWEKLYVGKYYYDKDKKQLIIWHNHLFVLKLKDSISNVLDNEINEKRLEIENGEFKYNNFPTNVIDIVYNNKLTNSKDSAPKHLTALTTTFSYYKINYKKPVVHWLSYIPVHPELLEPEKPTDKNDNNTDKDNITNHIDIIYPKLDASTIKENIKKIINLEEFTLNLIK
nr:putative per os infectivity factor PIF8 [Microplitis mediator]